MILLDCLSIVEPGYHVPTASRPIEEPRIRAIWSMCACGIDEVRLGRTQCEECIQKTAAGMAERIRHRQVERAAKSAKRARDREDARRERLAAVVPTCTCGRPARPGATCGRRMCR